MARKTDKNKKQGPEGRKSRLRIPLPFDKAVEGLLKVKPKKRHGR